jgi:hypothetical protein
MTPPVVVRLDFFWRMHHEEANSWVRFLICGAHVVFWYIIYMYEFPCFAWRYELTANGAMNIQRTEVLSWLFLRHGGELWYILPHLDIFSLNKIVQDLYILSGFSFLWLLLVLIVHLACWTWFPENGVWFLVFRGFHFQKFNVDLYFRSKLKFCCTGSG